MRSNLLKLAIWIVGLHFAFDLVHTLAHLMLSILAASPLDLLFILLVIYLAPLLALALLFTKRAASLGGWLLFLSMLASLAYGLLHHFVLPGEDSALTMPASSWQPVFAATAYSLLVLEAAGTLLGVQLLRTANRVEAAIQSKTANRANV